MARHVARARLYSNILTATGPVSAGGDGGKDFEMFRTYVAVSRDPGSTFADRATGERMSATSVSRWRVLERERGDVRPKALSGDRKSPRIDAHREAILEALGSEADRC